MDHIHKLAIVLAYVRVHIKCKRKQNIPKCVYDVTGIQYSYIKSNTVTSCEVCLICFIVFEDIEI